MRELVTSLSFSSGLDLHVFALFLRDTYFTLEDIPHCVSEHECFHLDATAMQYFFNHSLKSEVLMMTTFSMLLLKPDLPFNYRFGTSCLISGQAPHSSFSYNLSLPQMSVNHKYFVITNLNFFFFFF